jgi:hypothetical protein
VFECDQVKIKTLSTYCEQVGRRGKDYEMNTRIAFINYAERKVNFQLNVVYNNSFLKSGLFYQLIAGVEG